MLYKQVKVCELFGDHSIDRKLTRGDGARMAWPTMGLMELALR